MDYEFVIITAESPAEIIKEENMSKKYSKNSTLQTALIVVACVIALVAIFCLAVLIGCSIHGLTFKAQLAEWFTKKAVETVTTSTSTSAAAGMFGLLR